MNAATQANLEAERAVIAGLCRLAPDDAAHTVIKLGIAVDLFNHPPTREAFVAIAALCTDGIQPDPATLSNAMSLAARVEYETSMSEHASAANLPVYVRLLKDCHRERQLQAARARLVEAALAGQPDHEVQAILDSIKRISTWNDADPTRPPPFRPFSEDELTAARLTPKCIVANYLYADLALVAAAGGTGKTTMLIYEAVCIALGMDLWGCRVVTSGVTLFVTAEDSGDLFAARLNAVMNAMNLGAAAREQARRRIMVWDVTGSLVRLAELDKRGNLQLTRLADDIVEAYRDAGLVQVVFDPAISFGPGERVVNDGEQAVVVACRRIVRGLDCCTRLNHHTGKVNARNGAIDQYASRGGTALPDGCRMVTILANARDYPGTPPDGFELVANDSGFILARPKLSYAPPQPNLWVRRRGWAFDYFVEERRGTDEILAEDANKVHAFLVEELRDGRWYTARSLEDSNKLRLSKKRLRAALVNLEAVGRVADRELPSNERKGARKTYIQPLGHCADLSSAIDPENDASDPASPSIAPPSIIAPPYREKENGAIDRRFSFSNSLNAPPDNGAIAAQWRNSDSAPSDADLTADPIEQRIEELIAAGYAPHCAKARVESEAREAKDGR